MHHDDVVGEAVCEEEALEVQKMASLGILGRPTLSPEDAMAGYLPPPWDRFANPDGSWRFAGSQPVRIGLMLRAEGWLKDPCCCIWLLHESLMEAGACPH